MRRRVGGVATSLVHQDGAVPVGDFDVVATTACWSPRKINLEFCELQPDDLATLNLYGFCLLDVSRVEIRVAW